MQGKDTTKSTFFQLFRPIFQGQILQILKLTGVDKYVKKLLTMKLFKLLVIAQFEQIRSLRDISNILHNEAYSRYLELESISHSQIARRLNALPTTMFQAIFQELVRQVGTRIGLPKIRDYLGNIYLIDATVISLCLTRYRWAEFRKTKSGIKLHLRLKLFEQGVLPEHASSSPFSRWQ